MLEKDFNFHSNLPLKLKKHGLQKIKFVDIKEISQNKGEKEIYFNFEIEHTYITAKNLFNCSPKKESKRSNSFQFISLALKSVFRFIQIS